jgi:TrmH family RNA methyltransferase
MCAAFRPSEPQLISSRRNPLVRQLRQLHTPAGRRQEGLVLLEGTHLAQEVLRLGLQPRQLLCTPAWGEAHPGLLSELVTRMDRSGSDHTLVSEAVLAAVATTEHPDGIVLTLEPPQPPAHGSTFVLVLDGIQDPGNLGTLLRTALAAGIEQVWLAGGADPLQPKVLRASAGAALALPQRRLQRQGVIELVGQALAAGQQVVAAVPPGVAGAQAYWQLDWRRPTLVLLGAEGPGLSPALLELATHRVCIPHSAAVESLNVAVAAAPLLLERWRQERMPGN